MPDAPAVHLYLGELEPAYRPEYTPNYRRLVRYTIDVSEGGGKLITDSGGPTKWGISHRGHPDVDIANLSREGAVEIYYRDYWLQVRGDSLPLEVAAVLFDGVVNSGDFWPRDGRSDAIQLWQQIVRVEPDGVVGPDTIAASQKGVRWKVLQYLVARALWYVELGRQRPGTHGPSVHGWLTRLFALALALGWESGRLADALLVERRA
jgi:lysozyme family protein